MNPFVCKQADASENAGKKKALLLTEDSTKLKNLKRHARSCGMHFRYVDIFADCKSMSQKEKILDKLIRDKTGFQGKVIFEVIYETLHISLRIHSSRAH